MLQDENEPNASTSAKDNPLNAHSKPEDATIANHILRLADLSYSMERDRYSSLLSSSGRLLTSISIISIALLTLLPTLFNEFAQYKLIIGVMYIIEFVVLIAALVFALVTQYRFQYKEVKSPAELAAHIIKEEECFTSAIIATEHYSNILEEPYQSVRGRNELLSMLDKCSVVLLTVALSLIVVFGIILITLYCSK